MLLDINIITISNRHISSEINNADFFEKYNKIWKKFEELMEINFEKNPPFCNNIIYCKNKNPNRRNIFKFSSIAILHSVSTEDNKHYPRAYVEECKYERREHISYFDNNSYSDSYSDFEE